jgi:hypothetical protein
MTNLVETASSETQEVIEQLNEAQLLISNAIEILSNTRLSSESKDFQNMVDTLDAIAGYNRHTTLYNLDKAFEEIMSGKLSVK